MAQSGQNRRKHPINAHKTLYVLKIKPYEKNIRRFGLGVKTIHPRGGRSLPYSSPINLSWKNPSERKGDRKGKLFLFPLSVHLTSSQPIQNELEKLLIFSNINVVFFLHNLGRRS